MYLLSTVDIVRSKYTVVFFYLVPFFFFPLSVANHIEILAGVEE